jgi:hypothetical protein
LVYEFIVGANVVSRVCGTVAGGEEDGRGETVVALGEEFGADVEARSFLAGGAFGDRKVGGFREVTVYDVVDVYALLRG